MTVETVDSIIERLRNEGARVTTARRVLLTVLLEAGGHRTADELIAAVQQRAPDVHASTIYRNLDELERLGVVVHAHLGHAAASYHLADEAHGHLVCENCGTTIEAAADLFDGLAAAARGRHGFVLRPFHFAVLGLCAECATRGPVSS